MKLITARPAAVAEADDESQRWSALETPESFGDQLPLKSFQQLYERVTDKHADKLDVTVPFSNIKFVDDTGAIDVDGVGRVDMSNLAFVQLCTRLRIPPDYMERCPLVLRNSNLSYWIEQNDERKIMLRIRKYPDRSGKKNAPVGALRAVLPQTYEPIDNHRIIDWVGTALDAAKGTMGIQSAKVKEASTHIRLLFEKPYLLADEETTLHFGVHVSDSEVGERSFMAHLVSFRAQHETGFLHAVDGDPLVSQRHIHIDFKALRRKFAECFAVAEENIESVVEQWNHAIDTPVADPHSYIRRFVRHNRLTNDFADSVIHAFDAEPVKNKLGIAIAVSRATAKLPIDMRVDTESLCGNYLAEGA